MTGSLLDRGKPIQIMVWCAARGGMRSVVEAYRNDGFLAAENVRLVTSYVDGGFLWRQVVLLGGLARFVWLLATRRVGLVHCHAAMRGSFWRKGIFSSIARLFGKPVILHLHGSEMTAFYHGLPPWARSLVRRHLEKATCVIALSESWRDFIRSIAPAANVVVVPNYVKLPPVPDIAARNAGEILFLGLVGDRKGVFDLIPAFAAVHRDHPSARLIIGGNGEIERAKLCALENGVSDAVELVGWTDGPAKAALLARAGMFVLPSHNEGLPMSVLEAMSNGLPVISTRIGGIPELITDGVDGILIESGDVDGLAAALADLLSNAALRDRLGIAARERIALCYSDTVVLPMLGRLYRESCGEDLAVLRSRSAT
jgi:glycosyltransferase involved in cell wall biosynthesis